MGINHLNIENACSTEMLVTMYKLHGVRCYRALISSHRRENFGCHSYK